MRHDAKGPFIIRNDGLTKSGRDIDLVKQLITLIAETGKVETKIVRFMSLNLAGLDLIVPFNIDMPPKNGMAAQACAKWTEILSAVENEYQHGE